MPIRAHVYRLYPTAEQSALLARWQGICHEIQRLLVLQRRIADDRLSIPLWDGRDARGRDHWRRRRLAKLPGPTWAGQSREVTALLAAEPSLRDCPRDCIDAVIKRVDEAYKRAWQTRGRVRWADRAADIGLQFRGASRGTRLVSQGQRRARWLLASSKHLGPLLVRMHHPLPEGAVVKQAHVTQRADGWYISFVCAEPPPVPLPEADIPLAGYNLNCRHDGTRQSVARRDDGKLFQIDDTDAAVQARLGTLQKLVDPHRRTRGAAKAADPKSARSVKRRERIAKIKQRAARQRTHQQQFVAKRIVQTANTIAVEDTDYAAMRRAKAEPAVEPQDIAAPQQARATMTRRVKRLTNRSMSSAAPGRLRALIEHKAERAGRVVIRVVSKGVTQICSMCDHELHPPIGLNVVQWTCPQCGTTHDRDINAARNVKRRAGG